MDPSIAKNTSDLGVAVCQTAIKGGRQGAKLFVERSFGAPSLSFATGTGLATSCMEEKTVVKVAIAGVVQEEQPDELLIDLISRTGGTVARLCYHHQLRPRQTCGRCQV